ncbi:uncharacterized protein LOC129755255 isoform X1 [Uranotaenia lowii]|uniref:uncharacterized protein LOC129755255 isoform X1 n=1 Tax=Uranotaenia lowii TaxID=190385 RepID=UPI002479AB4A|nr:uncharacterized protein LOC129755255 isoform X1 [Uranotaenia lowii]
MLLQVSWVRHRDIHLLTVGRYTYTSDQRFRAIHHPHTEDWILQIKYPQHRDSGIYECQISTTPHMSHFVHLNVIEPSTEIIGAPDLYIESGSTINLTCVVKDSPEPPAYIFWNHNNVIISYDSPRGGVSVITEKGDTTTSFLLIQSARPSDSGQYTCNPSNAKSKSVTVHVLNGVSHSVSRGVPSSNAARGPTASSHASSPSVLGAFVCLHLVASFGFLPAVSGFRSTRSCIRNIRNVASWLLNAAYSDRFLVGPILRLTHTVYRVLINQAAAAKQLNHHRLVFCDFDSKTGTRSSRSSQPSSLLTLVTSICSFLRLLLAQVRTRLAQLVLVQLLAQVLISSRLPRNKHRWWPTSVLLPLLRPLQRLWRRTTQRVSRRQSLRPSGDSYINDHSFTFVLNHYLWNRRFAVR